MGLCVDKCLKGIVYKPKSSITTITASITTSIWPYSYCFNARGDSNSIKKEWIWPSLECARERYKWEFNCTWPGHKFIGGAVTIWTLYFFVFGLRLLIGRDLVTWFHSQHLKFSIYDSLHASVIQPYTIILLWVCCTKCFSSPVIPNTPIYRAIWGKKKTW